MKFFYEKLHIEEQNNLQKLIKNPDHETSISKIVSTSGKHYQKTGARQAPELVTCRHIRQTFANDRLVPHNFNDVRECLKHGCILLSTFSITDFNS